MDNRRARIAWRPAAVAAVLCSLAGGVGAADRPAHPARVYWGDTHLHSALSTDAFGLGVRLGADAAFRFACGKKVKSTGGLQARLARPLDFVVLAEHSESLGLMMRVARGDRTLMQNPRAREIHELMRGGAEGLAKLKQLMMTSEGRKGTAKLLGELATPAMQQTIWSDLLAVAERHNRPGRFTTLLGFEWSLAPQGDNVHRVVVFRDGPERVGTVLPLSSVKAPAPEMLWQYLADYESGTGGRVLAIPHNGNLSNGTMFPDRTSLGGVPVDAQWAATRARWEPLAEVTQIKGDGESHPLLSPDDAFAGYETWDRGNMMGVPKKPEMLPFEYARSALKLGLQIEARTGVNPYRFGMLGSTDSHTALATADDDNFFGKHSGVEPAAGRWKATVGDTPQGSVPGWMMAASGYAGVWATDNTREALWDALARREVYASTGPRMTVRFFGGFALPADAAQAADPAAVGYSTGVPMGGELQPAAGGAPRFLVAANRDPEGANLDRVQVVKGWLDAQGALHEKVYDVAWSDPATRRPDAAGRLPAVGNTVDVARATWQDTIGAAELSTVWEDPAFDPAQPAFYYARVLQIPTPRWTAWDALRYKVAMGPEVPMVTQERVYTSPIWYRPAA